MGRPRTRGIKVGPGVEALPDAGHARREVLRKRLDNLNETAEKMLGQTDTQLYSIDPAKLKAVPEILKHLNNFNEFEVTDPKPGYAYMWEREHTTSIARKKSEARMWLGPGHGGWEVVSSKAEPECHDLITVEGTRRIGDVILMRIPLESYILIQKRQLLMSAFRQGNIAAKLSDFVQGNEKMVRVISGNDDPRNLYAKEIKGGGPIQHVSRAPIEETPSL